MTDDARSTGHNSIEAGHVTVSRMEWRECPRHSCYEVSEFGDIKHGVGAGLKRQTLIRGYINEDGYVAYALINNNGNRSPVRAHRLVAEAFIGPCPSSKHEVAHDSGSRLANHYSQLRWATRKENDDDRILHKTMLYGEKNGRATITEKDVIDIRNAYHEIKASRGKRKVSELDDRYGLARATIIRIAKGQLWKHVPMPEKE